MNTVKMPIPMLPEATRALERDEIYIKIKIKDLNTTWFFCETGNSALEADPKISPNQKKDR